MHAPKLGRTLRSIGFSGLLGLAAATCVSDFVEAPKPPGPALPAVALTFEVQPSSAIAGDNLAPAVEVAVRDSLGNKIPSDSSTVVTLSITQGTGTPRANLRGARSTIARGGIASFSSVSVDSAGTGYTLTANATGLSGAVSGSFSISAGDASKIMFAKQPTNVVAGRPITPAVQVAIVDAVGNPVPSAGGTISVELLNGGGTTLSGTTAQSTSSGVATFGDLTISGTASGLMLRATGGDFSAVTSNPFSSLEPTDAIRLEFRVQPSNSSSGAALAPAVRVAAVNMLGNTVTTASVPVTLTLQPGFGTAGANLGGTTTVTTMAGEASFGNLTVDLTGSDYHLVASAPGLTAAVSGGFEIGAGAASRLRFLVQPQDRPAGTPFAPDLQVAIQDATGNTVTTSSAAVTLYITAGTGTGGAQLSGTTTVSASAGIAVFPGVSVNTAGSGYSLTAVSTGLASEVSSAFTITASGPPPTATVTVTPGSAALGSIGATQSFSAQARDAGGNPVAGASYTWSSSNTAVATIDGNGVATARGAGSTTISAVSGGVTGTASLSVGQSTASVVVTRTGPDTLRAFGATSGFTAEAKDANGNTISGRPVSWSSDNTSVATVDASGVATARGNGGAGIRATIDGVTGSSTIAVLQAVASVSINPASFNLNDGATRELTANPVDANGNTVTRALAFTWTSSDTTLVRVTQSTTDPAKATATRLAGGNVTITVSVESKSGTSTAH